MCSPPAFHLLHITNTADNKPSLLVFSINNLIGVATSPKHAVMFDKCYLSENRWFHLVITHAVSKRSFSGPAASPISLYINGILVETQKLVYPSSAPKDISAYIGTCMELKCKSRFVWRLGPCYLLQDCINHVSVNALFCAGPRYDGGFFGEDGSGNVVMTHELLSAANITCLQTLESSTVPTFDTVLKIIPMPISPEMVIFNFSARRIAALTTDEDPAVAAAARRSGSNVAGDGMEFISNGGLYPLPFALLQGGAQAFTPIRVGTTAGNIAGGGIPFILRIIGSATTRSSLHLALTLLRSLMCHNTTFLLAMEQLHAYESIAYLLSKSSNLLDERSLRFIYTIIGLGDELSGKPSANVSGVGEIVTNIQAAFNIIFCWDIWKNTNIATQKRYFEILQRSIDGSTPDIIAINRAQYQNVRLVRYLLNLFTTEELSEEVMPHNIMVLKLLLLHEPEIDEVYAVATFLISTLSTQFGKNHHRPTLSKTDAAKLRHRARFVRNLLFEMLIQVTTESQALPASSSFSTLGKALNLRWFYFFLASGIHSSTILLVLKLLGLIYPIVGNKKKGSQVVNHLLNGVCFAFTSFFFVF